MKLIRWLAFTIAVLVSVNGCVSRPNVPTPSLPRYSLPDAFEVTGRASVKYEGGGDYIRFKWQIDKARTKIYLYSPIGTHVAEINITPDEAILRKGQQEWRAADAEALMDKLLTWHFPVKGLHYWILGLAVPDIPATWESNAEGWHLMQAGWRMRFNQYVEVEEKNMSRQVPKRVEVNSPDLTINMVIDQWRLEKVDE